MREGQKNYIPLAQVQSCGPTETKKFRFSPKNGGRKTKNQFSSFLAKIWPYLMIFQSFTLSPHIPLGKMAKI